jgi:hypothetical protein
MLFRFGIKTMNVSVVRNILRVEKELSLQNKREIISEWFDRRGTYRCENMLLKNIRVNQNLLNSID